ncbi:MAG TPA: histidine kinase [Terriglobales bacterium]
MAAQSPDLIRTERNAPRASTLALAGWIFLLWTIFGLLSMFQMYANTWDERGVYTWWMIIRLTLGDSLLKALLTMPLAFVLPKIPFTREKWKRRTAQYVGILLLFILVHGVVRPFAVPFIIWMGPQSHYTVWQKIQIEWESIIVADAWGLALVVLIFHVIRYREQMRARELHEERLQAQLARAELQILKMQLQPHFLFNTLNTIYNLAPQNSRKAQLMIARLSELLRLSLEHVSTETVPLQRELEFLNSYLEVEKTRFEERLQIVFDIDPETLDAEVPNMILQPLVENSIRHGIGKKAAGGTIRISSRKTGSKLVLVVADDGKGLSPGLGSVARGIGLSNTRARLTQLYGQDFHFDLSPAMEGTKATIEIPFQTKLAKDREESVI